MSYAAANKVFMFFLFRLLFGKFIQPEQEGRFLVKVVSGSAYQVFLDESFRELVDFKRQNEEEQNRIFNELTVTGLGLLLLLIDDKLPSIKDERKNFWKEVRDKIPELFTAWLESLGIAKTYVEIWTKLIDLRMDEYLKDRGITRNAWAEELLKENDEEMNDAAVRVETMTVSSLLHITRGKAKPRSPLHFHMRTWLSALDHKLRKRVGW